MNEGKTLAYSKATSFLTFITKRSILDVAAALDPPLKMKSQKICFQVHTDINFKQTNLRIFEENC